jgi:protein TonB
MRNFTILAALAVLGCARESPDQAPPVTSTASAKPPAAKAESPAENSPLRVEGEVTAPVAIKRVEPTLPKRLSQAGPLILKAVIDEQGNVRDVRVIRDGTSPSVAPAYVEAIKQWKFRPATLRGKPVAVEYDLSVLIHVK